MISVFKAALPATNVWRSKTAICKVFIRQVWTLKKPFKQGTAMALYLFSPQHLKPGAVPPTSQLTGKCVWEGVWAPACDLNRECQTRLSFSVYLYISSLVTHRLISTLCLNRDADVLFLNGLHSRPSYLFNAFVDVECFFCLFLLAYLLKSASVGFLFC